MSSLVDLPNELLLLIHSEIDEYDLLTHVCYLQLCSRTRACYARSPPRFWRRLARTHGLGLSRMEEDTELVWRKVAVECAEHVWVCQHPECGEQRLKENREAMDKAILQWEDLDCEETIVHDEVWDGTDPGGDNTPSTLFLHIDFNSAFPCVEDSESKRSKGILKCAFLKATPPVAYRTSDLVEYHPVALRTFATFPPMAMMDTYDPKHYDSDGGLQIRNPDGVTVYDVLIAFSEVMSFNMTSKNLRLLMDYTPPRNFFPKTWTVADVLQATPVVGSWFQLTHWQGFVQEEPTLFSCVFEPKQLPNDVREHINMYKAKTKR
ncbi:hypothetical protein PsYK624_169050 [Phanerochaete sordida]|uniref:F-box domain-containing protein n=1 Tax=Phanerochaete sordida TaxID=48140 RepID=A0A9P3GRN2_9APHY|nr:hypothetical protein PsYK624_169050 [Phanerochaete sordida]